jgi:Na+/proline symporter
MNLSKLLLTISLFSFALQMPIQASNFGLKSRALIGLFAAGGSALATGAALVADSFKRNNAVSTQDQIIDLKAQLDYLQNKELNRWHYNDGIFAGVVATVLVGAIILAIISTPEKSTGVTGSTGLEGLSAQIGRTNDTLQNDKELAVKA